MRHFCHGFLLLLAAFLAFTPAAPASQDETPFDPVVRHGKIVNGTGNPWFPSDAACNGERKYGLTVRLKQEIAFEASGRVANVSLGEFRPANFGDDDAEVFRVTMICFGIQKDLTGTSATLCPLDQHLDRDQFVDTIDGFHRG